MAKYKKEANLMSDENKRFSASLSRLRNFITVKEIDRRHWSKENFGNPDGSLFTVCRVLIPIFSLYLIASMVIYCAIRDAQAVLANLQDNMMGLSYDAQTSGVNIIMIYVTFMCLLLIAGNIVLFCKKYYAGGFISLAATLGTLVHILTQLGIPMPEDNTKYITMFSISSGVYLILALLIGYVLLCKFKAKRTVNKLVDEVLTKISRGTSDMLTPEGYCEKIDEYIEKEKNKIVEDRSGDRKNSDSFLRFGELDEDKPENDE